MAFFSWRKDYEVGVQQIDTEHLELFGLVNEFHEGHSRGAPAREISQLLNRLVAYAEKHFQHEEKLMLDNEYPRIEAHRNLHVELVTAVFAINERLSHDAAQAGSETARFVKNWLVDHILKEDMDFSDFLRRKTNKAKLAGQVESAAKDATATEKPAAGSPDKSKSGTAE